MSRPDMSQIFPPSKDLYSVDTISSPDSAVRGFRRQGTRRWPHLICIFAHVCALDEEFTYFQHATEKKKDMRTDDNNE